MAEEGTLTKPYRRNALSLTLVGIFLTSFVLGNVIGTTQFVTIFYVRLSEGMKQIIPSLIRDGHVYTMSVPAGVIAYPFTFLVTDLMFELYGPQRHNLLCWWGLL